MMRAVSIGQEAPVACDPGAAPALIWVGIGQLFIDDSYQRPLGEANWRRIRSIAQAFHWSKFSPLIVARALDDKFAVIDGQHRAHAAQLCGLERVPALVVDASVAEQARAFVGVNAVTIRISAQAMFKAAVAAREEWAVDLDRVVRDAGCKVATCVASTRDKKPGVIYATGQIRKAIPDGHGAAVTAALAALREYDTTGRVPLWSDYILRPWIHAFACGQFTLPDLTPNHLAAVLARRDPFRVVESASMEQGNRIDAAAKIWRAMLRDVMRDRRAGSKLAVTA